MNLQETRVWVEGLLPDPVTVTARRIGEDQPAFTVAEASLGGGDTGEREETVAMTVDAARIDPGLRTEDGSDLRVELLTVVVGHSARAGEIICAAAAMIHADPVAYSPQPGTFLPDVAHAVDGSITAKHGLLVVPFVWSDGVPHMHEVQQGGRRGKNHHARVEFTHPGRLTVPAQVVMLNDKEFMLAQAEGLEAVQRLMAQEQTDVHDIYR